MSNNTKLIRNSTAEFLIFTGQAGEQSIEARYEDETVWLTQKLMAQLFSVDVRTVSEHLKNIYESGELTREATLRKFRTVQTEGSREVSRKLDFYNLDAIISVGYRVNSVRATQFRQWATRVLREFAIKGFVLDKKRLENGAFLGEDYFERLLAEIREIRLSERKFYQKITDIYATAVDYNRDAPTTKAFFGKVQNKLHFAIHGHTAAELIVQRANSNKPNMGLSTWEGAPDGKILKTDVAVAKNYLTREELEALGRIVNAYLDLAEERAQRRIPMTMEDWAKRANRDRHHSRANRDTRANRDRHHSAFTALPRTDGGQLVSRAQRMSFKRGIRDRHCFRLPGNSPWIGALTGCLPFPDTGLPPLDLPLALAGALPDEMEAAIIRTGVDDGVRYWPLNQP